MARSMSVMVNIGARLNSSLGASAMGAERRMTAMARHMKRQAAEVRAAWAGADRAIGGFGRNMRNFAYSASLPAAGLSAFGARTAYEWAKVGNELQSVTQMSDRARKDVEAIARAQIGDPTENLRAALDLARSGFGEDGKGGFDAGAFRTALPTVIRMAKSDPSVDTEAAADIATNILQGMRLPVKNFAAEMDKIAFAASKSSTDMRLLGLSFKYAGPMAARLGSNMSQMNAAFMTMANAGIKGSESGVAMRAMFVRMVKPTKGGMAALDQLGINLGDYVKGRRASTADDVVAFMAAQGLDVRGQRSHIAKAMASGATGAQLNSLLTEIVAGATGAQDAAARQEIASGITDALTSAADEVDWVGFMNALRDKGASVAQINTIFDSRQGTRLMTLMSGDDLNRNLRLMQEGAPGWLAKMFMVSNKGVVGAFGRLQQSFGNFLITLAESGVIDTAANFMNRLSGAIDGLSKANPSLLKFATYATLGAAVLGPVSMIAGGLASGLRVLWGAGKLAWPLIARLGGGLGRMALGVGKLRGMALGLRMLAMAGLGPLLAVGWPVAATIAGIGLAMGLIVAKWNGIKAFFSGFGEGFRKALGEENMALLSKAGGALVSFANYLNPVGIILASVGKAFGKVWEWTSKLFAPAETEKWRSWGRVAGEAVGFLAGKIAWLIEKAVAAKSALSSMFSAPGGAPGMIGTPPTRQLGGGVRRGALYSVGERGRELFAPGMSGSIIPARATAAMLALASAGAPLPAAATPMAVTFNISGVTDPQAVARVVDERLRRLARDQRRALSD